MTDDKQDRYVATLSPSIPGIDEANVGDLLADAKKRADAAFPSFPDDVRLLIHDRQDDYATVARRRAGHAW